MDLPPNLQHRVDALCARDPGARSVVTDIIRYFKNDHKAADSTNTSSLGDHHHAPVFTTVFNSMSMILPERRKVSLGFNDTHAGVLLNDDILHMGAFKSELNVALCLALPKRPKPLWNLILTNLAGEGPWFVFTIPDASADKFNSNCKGTQSLKAAVVECIRPLVRYLYDEDRPTLAVTSYIGAREGTLYFLDEFVFFGYKKPLVLLNLAEIESVSFTVITRLTFNIVVQAVDGQNYEFGMIPHNHYEAISKYISKHGLDDHSLAEERRAKKQRTEPSALEEANIQVKEDQANKGGESSGDDSDDEDYTSHAQESGGSGESSEEEEVVEDQKPSSG